MVKKFCSWKVAVAMVANTVIHRLLNKQHNVNPAEETDTAAVICTNCEEIFAKIK